MSSVRNTSGDSVRWALHRVQQRVWDVLACSLAFKFFDVAILSPVAAGGLRLLLERWGRASVGNFEIAAFLISPPGLIALLGSGSLVVATHFLELAGLMRLLSDRQLPWWQAFGRTTGLLHRLFLLGLRQVATYLLLALPFLAAIGLVYATLWAGRDLNGLIVLRPTVFWVGLGLAAALAFVYSLLAASQFLRWLFAVPILLFEPPPSPIETLERSAELTRGRLAALAVALGTWSILQVLIAAVVAAVFRFGAAWVLGQVGHSLAAAISTTAALLLVNGVILTCLSIFGWSTFAALLLSLYREAAGETLAAREEVWTSERAWRLPRRWGVMSFMAAVGVGGLLVSGGLLSRLDLDERVEITAHRAGALRGPENSVAALRQAILDRADWAEIDVQRTADDKLVVMHDIDLARIGGGNRRVDQVTLAEIQALDIGSQFGPQFAGERVPTFDEILAAVGDKLRLNVELKPHGRDDAGPLAEQTVAAIKKAGLVERCRICSQSFESLERTRELEPRLQVGFIAAVSVGDLARLKVDYLMVSADRVKRALVDRAAVHGIEIHAWTVNSADQVAPLIDEGVANIITDDPVVIRTRLNEVEALGPVNRLLLRAHHVLSR